MTLKTIYNYKVVKMIYKNKIIIIYYKKTTKMNNQFKIYNKRKIKINNQYKIYILILMNCKINKYLC